jgi:hypothetical protein
MAALCYIGVRSKTMKVKLTEDYTDYFGQRFTAGKTGETTTRQICPGTVIVEFDGYDELKTKHYRMLAEHSEGFNVLPWVGYIPVRLLVME